MEGKNRRSKSSKSKYCKRKVEKQPGQSGPELAGDGFSCPCGQGTLPPPPDKPPTDDELWDLQFSRWWGWNWVRRHEDGRNVNRTDVKTSTPQMDGNKCEPCGLQQSHSSPERVIRTCEMAPQRPLPSESRRSTTSHAPRRPPQKKNTFKSFCRMCKCFYKENKQKMRKMDTQQKQNLKGRYDTPCASVQADEYERNSIIFERCCSEGRASVSTVIYQKESRTRRQTSRCHCHRMQSWTKEKSETTSSEECLCHRSTSKNNQPQNDESVNYLAQRNVSGDSNSSCCCECRCCHSCCCCCYVPQKLDGFMKCPCVVNIDKTICCCCGGEIEEPQKLDVEVGTAISAFKCVCVDRGTSAKNIWEGVPKTVQTCASKQQQQSSAGKKHCCCCGKRQSSPYKMPKTYPCICKSQKQVQKPVQLICCAQCPQYQQKCRCCPCGSSSIGGGNKSGGSLNGKTIQDGSLTGKTIQEEKAESTVVNFATVYQPNAKEYFKSPHSGQIYSLKIPGMPFNGINIENKKFPKLLDVDDKTKTFRSNVLNTDIQDAEHLHILSSVCDALMTSKEQTFMDSEFMLNGLFASRQSASKDTATKSFSTKPVLSDSTVHTTTMQTEKDEGTKSTAISRTTIECGNTCELKPGEMDEEIQTRHYRDAFNVTDYIRETTAAENTDPVPLDSFIMQTDPEPATKETGESPYKLQPYMEHNNTKMTQIKLCARSPNRFERHEATCTTLTPGAYLSEKQRVAKETSVAVEQNIFTSDTLTVKSRGYFRATKSRTNLQDMSKTYDVLYSNLENIRKICNSPMSLVPEVVSPATSEASYNGQMPDASLENLENVLQECMQQCGAETLRETDDERLLTCLPPHQTQQQEEEEVNCAGVSLATSISDKIRFFEVLNGAEDPGANVDDQCQTNVYKERYKSARNKERAWRDLKRK